MIDPVWYWFWVGALGIAGLLAGSFAGAQVWRLRARQLQEDKQANEPYDKRQLKKLEPLLDTSVVSDRSRCLECAHQLAWYDLLPLISWLSTSGKCRYCAKPIGWFEPVIELGVMTFFVGSFLLWPAALDAPLAITIFASWLLAGVPLAILFAYDAKWFLLPDGPMAAFIALSALHAGLLLYSEDLTIGALVSLLGAIGVISGLYGLLHVVSRGTWVGYGDVTLGVGLGLLLGKWELAVVAVFLANLIGTLIVAPGLTRGTIDRKSHMPFGPLLILGMIIAYFFGQPIVDWYLGFL